MNFTYRSFSCSVRVFADSDGIVVRFYDEAREHSAEQIRDLVVVDPGFGYMTILSKGEHAALLSGLLDETIFTSDEMVEAAIEFVEKLFPAAAKAYVPHHVRLVRATRYVEYNGEY